MIHNVDNSHFLKLWVKSQASITTVSMVKTKGFTSSALAVLFSKLPHLEELNLNEIGIVTDGVLLAIAETCRNIRQLSFTFSPSVTNAGLKTFANCVNAASLKSLDMTGCTGVTMVGIEALVKGVSELTSFTCDQMPGLTSHRAITHNLLNLEHFR